MYLSRQEFETMGRLKITWHRDELSEMFLTGYHKFKASKFSIEGLAKESGSRLDILAIVSKNEGVGNFRAFIAAAKLRYKTIVIHVILNPELNAIIGRYGFVLGEERLSMIWKGE